MDNKTIRLMNLNLLRTECDPSTWAELEKRTGVKQNYISQIVGKGEHKRAMGESVARRLERGMGKPKGWMDNSHLGQLAEANDDGENLEEIIRLIPGLDAEEADLIHKVLRGLRLADE